MRTFYIYCHTTPSGKRYVGQTCKPLHVRWANGRGYQGNPYFYNAIKKYGWDNIEHEILCVVHYKSVADLFEKHYIAKFNTFDHSKGYNLTRGGEGTIGHVVSEEARRKIGIANTGNTWSEERKKSFSEYMSGENNGMYGRHHSEESRKKMSENRKGAPVSEEMRKFRTSVLLEANKKRQKAVRQLDLDGNLIATYQGVNEAVRATGCNLSSIVRICQGYQNTTHGFRWEYEDPELRKKAEEVRRNKHPNISIPVIQCDMDGNEIRRFESMHKAARFIRASQDTIKHCCDGIKESHRGFKWKYANQAA